MAGVGGQLIGWPDPFCDQLAGRGFLVVRFDNRDCGLSTKIEGGPEPDPVAAYFGDASSASYTLDDMADDAAALLDALGMEAAHVVGRSLGGMIAQAMAIRHPERTLSLGCISSSTGDPTVGQPTPEGLAVLARPAATTREEFVEGDVAAHRVLGSRRYPVDDDDRRRQAGRCYDRAHCPEGTARQLCAVIVSGDRTEGLSRLTLPTVVVHGTDDVLVHPSGGEATAKAVPGAELVMIEGMGHDLPPAVWPTIVDSVVANAARAGGGQRR